MARVARRKSKSGIYHIILRGINKQTIFEEEEDKMRFLKTVEKYKSVSDYKVYGYCLMDNHVHLLMKEETESISKGIQRISSSYVFWYNLKYDRNGHLFQDRFKSENVEDQRYFLTVLRYIHQNPMKAGLNQDVLHSDWTSAKDYLFKKMASMIDIDFGLRLFSEDRVKARNLYVNYMQKENNDECLEYFVRVRKTDQEILEYMREAGIESTSKIQQLDKKYRNEILADLKRMDGVSLRQLSRITGIPKSVIHEI